MLKATSMKNYLSKVLAYRINLTSHFCLTCGGHVKLISIIDCGEALPENFADKQKNGFLCLDHNIISILFE